MPNKMAKHTKFDYKHYDVRSTATNDVAILRYAYTLVEN